MQTALRGPALASKAHLGKGLATRLPVRLSPRAHTSKRVMAFREEEEEKTRQASKPGGQQVFPGQSDITYRAPSENVPYRVEDPALRMIPAFTRRREHIVARVAMLGVVAMWAGEVMFGLGPMGQLASETNVPLGWAFWATSFLALAQLMLGLNKGSPTMTEANRRDLARRKKGWLGMTSIEPDTSARIDPFADPGKFFLRTELTLGRTAMLIFAGAMLVEFALNGQSPLAHFGFITPGVTLGEAPAWLKLGMLTFALGGLGVFSAFGTREDMDTY